MQKSTNLSPIAKEIAEDLWNIKAIQINMDVPFTSISGIRSPLYYDTMKVNADIEVRKRVVGAFVNIIESHFANAEVIAGVATGGIPLGVLIADKLNLPFIYVRQAPKEHGLKKQVEGFYEPGNKVLLIEDIISTGHSSLKAIEGLKNENLEIVGLISLMTYGIESVINLIEIENIKHYNVCDLETILELALSKGNISNEDKMSILNFIASSENLS